MNYVKVFPRRSTSSSCLNRKAKAAAQRVLDKCKAGDVRSWERMAWALRVTGDLDEVRERELRVMP